MGTNPQPPSPRGFDHSRAYRRRVLAAVPLAALVVGVLVLVFGRVTMEKFERVVGARGELHVLPDITIVPDDDLRTVPRRERDLETVSSLDIDLPEDGPEQRKFSPVRAPRAVEKDRLELPEFDDQPVRTEPRRSRTTTSDEFVLVHMVEPKYPRRELEAGVEGSVLVEVLVEPDGHVSRARALSRVGPESFETASLEAVRQFVFAPPPSRDGPPKATWVSFMIKFRIYG